MHLALYRKYRSATFDEVCGQNHITSVLKYQAKTGRVSHAYLFCGSRGTGKTSCAKILAKAVNCENPIDGNPCCKCESCLSIDRGSATDVVEMDAASETGVDYIRSIKEEVQYPPALLKKRVYIIDEIHMLSESAFNALLKTLEEPPEHVVFILATTELHKMPSTVVSRCQRFDFRRLAVKTICERLEYIAERENIKLEHAASQLIAKQAQGGMRDAIGLFELCSGNGADVTESRVFEILGINGYENVAKTAESIAKEDISALFDAVASVCASSKDITVFWQELTSFYRDMLIEKYSENPVEYLDLTESEYEILRKTSSLFTLSELFRHSKILDDALKDMNRMPQTKRMTAEFALVKMCDGTSDTSPDALLARIEALENKINSSPKGFFDAGNTEKIENAAKTANSVKSDTAADMRKAEKKEFSQKVQSTPPKPNGETSNKSFFEPFTDMPPAKESKSAGNGYIRLKDTGEVIERLGKTDELAAAIISDSKIEVSADASKIRIVTENGFAATYFTDEICRKVAGVFLAAKITDREAKVEIVYKAGRDAAPYESLFED